MLVKSAASSLPECLRLPDKGAANLHPGFGGKDRKSRASDSNISQRDVRPWTLFDRGIKKMASWLCVCLTNRPAPVWGAGCPFNVPAGLYTLCASLHPSTPLYTSPHPSKPSTPFYAPVTPCLPLYT